MSILRAKHDGKNAAALSSLLAGDLNLSDVGAHCDLINDEFMMEGITPDFEPNEYGRELEELLDLVNGPRLSLGSP